MQQTLEEAAREYSSQWAWNSQPDMWQSEKDFKAGVQWQAKQSTWISIKERLPETKDKVLVLNRMKHNGGYFISENYYENGDWATKLAMYYEEIAWMPIPSFDEILETNKDVLERIKEKGD